MYDVLVQIFNLNINFDLIFDYVPEPQKKEILDFINYIRTNPEKKDLIKYKISHKSKIIILEYINYILKKLKN